MWCLMWICGGRSEDLIVHMESWWLFDVIAHLRSGCPFKDILAHMKWGFTMNRVAHCGDVVTLCTDVVAHCGMRSLMVEM